MSKRKLNKPLLRRLARKLRRLRHEEHFDQSIWGSKTACGTAACIAGHAVLMAGWRLRSSEDDPTYLDLCVKKNGTTDSVEDAAARLLGVSAEDYAYDLFSGDPALSWPPPYAERWIDRDSTGERPSRIAADLLDAIADGRVEL
jgi:hypothetical protein